MAYDQCTVGQPLLAPDLPDATFDQDQRVGIQAFTGTAPTRFKSRADVEDAARMDIAQPYDLLNIFRDLPEMDFAFNRVLHILYI
jgi:hypothetical protein